MTEYDEDSRRLLDERTALRARVIDFINEEARLLDNRRFDEWLGLVTHDFTYAIPVTMTLDDPNASPWIDGSFVLNETRDSIANLWIKRYMTTTYDVAWGENPPQRVRRFISNTIVETSGTPGEHSVTSNVLLSFVRQSDPVTLVPAARLDRLREVDGMLRLARRVVHLDQSMLTTTHMRLIF